MESLKANGPCFGRHWRSLLDGMRVREFHKKRRAYLECGWISRSHHVHPSFFFFSSPTFFIFYFYLPSMYTEIRRSENNLTGPGGSPEARETRYRDLQSPRHAAVLPSVGGYKLSAPLVVTFFLTARPSRLNLILSPFFFFSFLRRAKDPPWHLVAGKSRFYTPSPIQISFYLCRHLELTRRIEENAGYKMRASRLPPPLKGQLFVFRVGS